MLKTEGGIYCVRRGGSWLDFMIFFSETRRLNITTKRAKRHKFLGLRLVRRT